MVDELEPAAGRPGTPTTWRRSTSPPRLSGCTSRPNLPISSAGTTSRSSIPGKCHGLAGHSEAGKTWVALAAAAQVLPSGGVVAFADFEDTEDTVVARLKALGVPGDILADRSRFRYIRPDLPLFARNRAGHLLPNGRAMEAFAEEYTGADLVVLDGVTEALSLHALNMNDASDVALFQKHLPPSPAASGAAVVNIDHLPHTAGKNSIAVLGSQHKRAGVDVMLIVDPVEPFGIGLSGSSVIRVTKDRPGQLRPRCDGPKRERWGDIRLTSLAGGETVRWEVVRPVDRPASDGRFVHQITGVLYQEAGLSLNQILARVTGNKEAKKAAVRTLIDDGRVLVEPGPNNAHLHYLVRHDGDY